MIGIFMYRKKTNHNNISFLQLRIKTSQTFIFDFWENLKDFVFQKQMTVFYEKYFLYLKNVPLIKIDQIIEIYQPNIVTQISIFSKTMFGWF